MASPEARRYPRWKSCILFRFRPETRTAGIAEVRRCVARYCGCQIAAWSLSLEGADAATQRAAETELMAWQWPTLGSAACSVGAGRQSLRWRSEEHTSELQS